MRILLHYCGIATNGYSCNRVWGQFTFDDAKRFRAEFSAAIRSPARRNIFRKRLSIEKLQQSRVEPGRILQEGEMTDVRQNHQPSGRDRSRDVFGVFAFDRLVMISLDTPHR